MLDSINRLDLNEGPAASRRASMITNVHATRSAVIREAFPADIDRTGPGSGILMPIGYLAGDVILSHSKRRQEPAACADRSNPEFQTDSRRSARPDELSQAGPLATSPALAPMNQRGG